MVKLMVVALEVTAVMLGVDGGIGCDGVDLMVVMVVIVVMFVSDGGAGQVSHTKQVRLLPEGSGQEEHDPFTLHLQECSMSSGSERSRLLRIHVVQGHDLAAFNALKSQRHL